MTTPASKKLTDKQAKALRWFRDDSRHPYKRVHRNTINALLRHGCIEEVYDTGYTSYVLTARGVDAARSGHIDFDVPDTRPQYVVNGRPKNHFRFGDSLHSRGHMLAIDGGYVRMRGGETPSPNVLFRHEDIMDAKEFSLSIQELRAVLLYLETHMPADKRVYLTALRQRDWIVQKCGCISTAVHGAEVTARISEMTGIPLSNKEDLIMTAGGHIARVDTLKTRIKAQAKEIEKLKAEIASLEW